MASVRSPLPVFLTKSRPLSSKTMPNGSEIFQSGEKQFSTAHFRDGSARTRGLTTNQAVPIISAASVAVMRFCFVSRRRDWTKESRGNQRSPFAYEVGVTARVIKKPGRAQRERAVRQHSQSPCSPARPPAHTPQTNAHTFCQKRRQLERQAANGGQSQTKRVREGEREERERETHPSGGGVEGGEQQQQRFFHEHKKHQSGPRMKELICRCGNEAGRRGSATPLHDGHLAHMKRSIRLMNSCTAVINNSGD